MNKLSLAPLKISSWQPWSSVLRAVEAVEVESCGATFLAIYGDQRILHTQPKVFLYPKDFRLLRNSLFSKVSVEIQRE